MLCISTSFQVLRAPESWSKPFFQPFSSFFVQFLPFSVISRMKSTKTVRKVFWPANGMWSTRLLVEIHNNLLFMMVLKPTCNIYQILTCYIQLFTSTKAKNEVNMLLLLHMGNSLSVRERNSEEQRERVSLFLCLWERERDCVCVRERERERERFCDC